MDLLKLPRGSTLGDFIDAGLEGEEVSPELALKIRNIAASWAQRRVDVDRVRVLEDLREILSAKTEK